MENISLLIKNFKNKKILVTGGSGFIGSHLVNKLVSLKSNLTVTVKYNSIIDNQRLVNVWNKIKVVEADLRNTDSVLSLKNKKFDYIFHLAAYNHVGDSFTHISETINSNLFSTINLLEHGPKYNKFIHMGSSEIYGLQKKIPFNTKENGQIDQLTSLAQTHKGSCHLIVHLMSSRGNSQRIRSRKLRVTSSQDFMKKLRDSFGKTNVWIS